ncbi:MAG: SMC-Scp complex subunit ScpB [Parachlamydiaceae bacterium]|nr:SMC-Scp complex subunit ScpB [Parachlamydiaceae bacterium]
MAKEINLLQPVIETAPFEPQQTTTHTYREADVATRMHLKRVVEALLFASSEPLPFTKIREITDSIYPLAPRVLKSILQELQYEYQAQQRAFRLEEIAQGYTLRTCEEFGDYIELLGRNKRTEKLSHAATEVLAIIAYKQPITRPQIEAIRGVDSSGTMANLLERQLIQPVGKLEAPGRPTLYGITQDFLKHFGLKDIKELPKLEMPQA